MAIDNAGPANRALDLEDANHLLYMRLDFLLGDLRESVSSPKTLPYKDYFTLASRDKQLTSDEVKLARGLLKKAIECREGDRDLAIKTHNEVVEIAIKWFMKDRVIFPLISIEAGTVVLSEGEEVE